MTGSLKTTGKGRSRGARDRRLSEKENGGTRIRLSGPARRAYAILLWTVLPFFLICSLLIGLADAFEASAKQPRPSPGQAADASAPADADGSGELSADLPKDGNRRYYILPLSDSQQDGVYALCEKYDVPPELVFGIISADAETSTPYSGASPRAAMSLTDGDAEWSASQLGITGQPTYEENLECGIFILQEYCHKDYDVNMIAMCYELGEQCAAELRAEGVQSTVYSRLVVRGVETLTQRPPKN